MASQKDIQKLINQAQAKIHSGDHRGALNDWPKIQSEIGQYEGLKPSDRRKLAEQVKKQLYDFSHSKPKPINIAEIEQHIKKKEKPDEDPKNPDEGRSWYT